MRGSIKTVGRYCRGEDGQTLVEYQLLVLLIAVGCIALMVTLGETIRNVFHGLVGLMP